MAYVTGSTVAKYQPLIDKELERIGCDSFTFKPWNPTNKNIDWIYQRYDLREQCECWYDDWHDGDQEKCTWYDPIGEGIWGMSQKKVNRTSRKCMKHIRHLASKRGRFYIGEGFGLIWIFWFGRDRSPHADYWWSFGKYKSSTGHFI